MLGLLTAMSLLGPKVSLCIVEPFALAWLGPFALEWLEPFALETLGPFALRVLVSFALWTLGPSFPSWTGGSPVRGGGAGLLIRRHGHFTPAREMRRDVRAPTARNHPEGRYVRKREFVDCKTSMTTHQDPCGGVFSICATRIWSFLTHYTQ